MSALVSSSSPRSARHKRGGYGTSRPVAELLARLQSLSPRVEQLLITGGLEIDATASRDPEFVAGVPAAARESVDLFTAVIELGDAWTPRLPQACARQVRYLARNMVPLDVVMRSCYSSVLLLFRLIAQADLSKEALAYLLEVQSRQGDRIMAAIAAEYRSEMKSIKRSPTRRLAGVVESLLAGEPGDTASLDYELDAWHLGLIAVGFEARPLFEALAERRDVRLLVVPRGPDTSWIWLGAERAISTEEIEALIPECGDAGSLALGEPRAGTDGWRLTHREAKTALGVISFGAGSRIRCADVLLPAALLRDHEMHRFLLDAYLRPFDRHRDAGVMRETLRSYLAHDCNASSAAGSLGVDRHTIQRRLQRAEEILGRRVDACRSELEVALRLERLLDTDKGS